tara:strand:- start:367 stop:861 length:495 start_codon:yes stop_codon:yes gene_type:complete
MSLVRNQTRKVYSFKSSGKSKSELEKEVTDTPVKLPIGIKTPITISRGNGLFEMHTDLSRQISDNLRNLILTNHGERLGFYDFGANLGPLVFDLGTDQGDALAIDRIRESVRKYMPFVSLQNFQVFIDRHDNKTLAKVGIQITYGIPLLDTATRSLEVMLYMGG